MSEKPRRSNHRQTSLDTAYQRYKIPSELQPLFQQWLSKISEASLVDDLIDIRNQLLEKEKQASTPAKADRAKLEAAIFILLIQYLAEKNNTPFGVLLIQVFNSFE